MSTYEPRSRGLPALDGWTNGAKALTVVIETPAGSRSKFKYDETLGVFRLDKLLPMGASFPFDFGFIPGTRGEDGDPLDVLVLGEEPTFSGCIMTVRLLGIIEAEQTAQGETIRNDRLLATPETRKIHPRVRSLGDLPAQQLDAIEHFFIAYNEAEGRRFVPLRRRGPAFAIRHVARGLRDASGARPGGST